MTRRQNAGILLILLFIFTGGCVSKSLPPQKDTELVKRLNRVNEILVMDILDRINTPEFWEQSYHYSSKEKVEFLLENKDISLPLIFKILDRDTARASSDWAGKFLSDFTPNTPYGLKNRQLASFFYIFRETKSIESIPYLCEFLRSIPGNVPAGLGEAGFSLDSIQYAIQTICNIIGPKPVVVSYEQGKTIKTITLPGIDIGPANGKSSYARMADLAEKWYEDYKKTLNKK
jgi:hypothetical protein